MRVKVAGWIIALLFLGGCNGYSYQTRRVALDPLAGAPPAISGAPGVGLAGRLALGGPTGGSGAGNGIATPVAQPELNGVIRLADRFYVTGDVQLAPYGGARSA